MPEDHPRHHEWVTGLAKECLASHRLHYANDAALQVSEPCSLHSTGARRDCGDCVRASFQALMARGVQVLERVVEQRDELEEQIRERDEQDFERLLETVRETTIELDAKFRPTTSAQFFEAELGDILRKLTGEEPWAVLVGALKRELVEAKTERDKALDEIEGWQAGQAKMGEERNAAFERLKDWKRGANKMVFGIDSPGYSENSAVLREEIEKGVSNLTEQRARIDEAYGEGRRRTRADCDRVIGSEIMSHDETRKRVREEIRLRANDKARNRHVMDVGHSPLVDTLIDRIVDLEAVLAGCVCELRWHRQNEKDGS